MGINFSDIVQAGVGVISLFILYQVLQSNSRESERRDTNAKIDRDRQDKIDERNMLLFASITGKQIEGTAAVTAAVTSAKTDVTSAIEKSGADVIEHVETSKDEVIEVVRLLAKVNTGIFKPAGSEPPDLTTMKLILKETYSAIEAAQAKAAGLAAQIAATTPESAASAPAQPAAESAAADTNVLPLASGE